MANELALRSCADVARPIARVARRCSTHREGGYRKRMLGGLTGDAGASLHERCCDVVAKAGNRQRLDDVIFMHRGQRRKCSGRGF